MAITLQDIAKTGWYHLENGTIDDQHVVATWTYDLESELRASGVSIQMTIVGGGIWVTDLDADNARATAFYDALTAATSPAAGWNLNMVPYFSYVNTFYAGDANNVYFVHGAEATYAIASDETISMTFPASLIQSGTVALTGDDHTITEDAV